ncbi:MAG: cytochrome c/FTR1 family iron permease, partial [Archangium sp.]
MRSTLLIVLLLASTAMADDARWHRVVGLLEYLEGDYANALATNDQAELEEQRGFADEVVKQLEAGGDEAAPYLERAKAIQTVIGEAKPATEVTPLCGALAKSIAKDKQLVQAAKRYPSLDEGKKQYEAICATCHGVTGAADTEVAKALDPPPANFLEAERMATLTPYKVFNTTSFGIPGTGMANFDSLPEDTRWAQAFHIFTLRQPACDHVPPRVSVAELATSTDVLLAQKYGEKEVACLRRKMPEEDGSSLAVAQKLLDEALVLYAKGDTAGARQAVVDAYLNGLEPVEPMLRARDERLVAQLEQAFTRTRVAAQSGEHFEAEVLEVKVLLGKAQNANTASGFWAVFVAALLILLREGFEAVVVVGALLAVLKKMQATQLAKVVHAGWISSLVFGGAAFMLAHQFFAGANREWLETVVALVAVGLLLYAALWLNARANISKHMTEVRGEMTQALASGSTVSLFFIAFSSVGRESLETALFLQGLAADSFDGAVWGAVAGLVALLGLIVMVRTVGFKLPMQTLFKVSTIALVVTAVMLLGKGVHGLQELGILPIRPVPFIQVDALGLFPDLWSLLAQLALA